MPEIDTQHYRASADPYVITLTVQTHGRFTVSVADRAMGMAVAGARVSLRFNGMDGSSGPVPVPAVNGPKGRIAGLYATTVGLMPGAYVVGIDVNGGAANAHIHIR